jgi:hypothetical protein
MPNSERVLNRKVQVLIKIAPPPIFPFPKKFGELLERESTTIFIPSGVKNGK